MVLTIISFILMIVIMMGGWNKSDSNLSSLYFFKADISDFKTNITKSGVLSTNIPGNVDDKLRTFLDELTSSEKSSNLSDVYQVYLWNYCQGSDKNGTVSLTKCSSKQARFWFNPVEVWGLNGTGVTDLVPNELEKGLNIYQKVANWMFVAYAIAFFTTLSSIVVGLLAICSRWGSCCTTIVSAASTLFSFLAALTSTILFSVLTGTFNTVLKAYGIKLHVGTKMMALDWVAFAFSLGATLFWTVSICCCSGKSDKPKGNGSYSAAAPFGARGGGYQSLGGDRNSYQQTSNVEMGNYGASPYKGRETAYEPFRHS